MWSLLRKKPESSFLDDYQGDNLPPMLFSNNKTQADVVSEILDAIKAGNKVIFIKGKCGSGKSAIALNLARHFKKTSIVVPIKSLQEQYEEDYTKNKFILKPDGKKLKISVIKGRNNFSCPFLDCHADNPELPCTIEIREKNFNKLLEYIGQNEYVDKKDFTSIQDVRRTSIAPACQYWSPLLPAKVNSRALDKAAKMTYKTVSDTDYSLFLRKPGCKYYEQYKNYADADVLIFNSRKYLIETAIGRKPKTDLDIIDECDEFLDSFAEEKRINLSRLLTALQNLPVNNSSKPAFQSLIFQINELILNYSQDDVEKLQSTQIKYLVDKILENKYLAEDEEENYYNRVLEICLEFQDFLNETYVSFSREKRKDSLFSRKQEDNCYLTLITINLAKKFSELVNKTSCLVLMSGTLHSFQVLKDIFNIKDFKVIEAETIMPGTIQKLRTGKEKNCKYGNCSREDFLKAFSYCLEQAKKPALVHITAFKDLPTEQEKILYNVHNLISREKLSELQKHENQVKKFKNKEIDILFTTKCSRGIDFPGEQCNSIILTRYPYPDINSIFWRILKKEKPEFYTEFYMDKARRDLLQKIYRGVRFKSDHVLVLSPDSRVLNAFLN